MIFRTIIYLLAVIGISTGAEAQIAMTRNAVLAQFGPPSEQGVTDRGDPYMIYAVEMTTPQSGSYMQIKSLFFLSPDDGQEFCYALQIQEPATEFASTVRWANLNLTRSGNNRWTDPSTEIDYKVYKEDNLVIMESVFNP